jgi:hypothetical protein
MSPRRLRNACLHVSYSHCGEHRVEYVRATSARWRSRRATLFR